MTDNGVKKQKPPSRGERAGGAWKFQLEVGRLMHGFGVAQPFDLILDQQFPSFELHDSQIIDRGMCQAIVDFSLKRLVLFFQFRKVRLHRHAACLLNTWPQNASSLSHRGPKSDGKGVNQTAANGTGRH
jgi:hypothetical protein